MKRAFLVLFLVITAGAWSQQSRPAPLTGTWELLMSQPYGTTLTTGASAVNATETVVLQERNGQLTGSATALRGGPGDAPPQNPLAGQRDGQTLGFDESFGSVVTSLTSPVRSVVGATAPGFLPHNMFFGALQPDGTLRGMMRDADGNFRPWSATRQ